MGQLILPKRYAPGFSSARAAPPENLVEIDRSHPLAEGLLFYSIGMRDLVSGKIAQPVVQWGSTNSGRNYGPMGFELESLGFETVDGGFVWENCVEFSRVHGTKKFTSAVSVSIISNTTNGVLHCVPKSSTAWTAPDTNWGLFQSGDTTSGLLRWTEPSIPSLGSAVTSTGYLIEDGLPYLYSVTKNDTTTVNFYRSGELFQGVESADASNTLDWPSQFNAYVLSRNTSATAWGTEGRVQLQAYWMRELEAGEHQAFYANPYALLRPRVPTLYYTAAASGAQARTPSFVASKGAI